MQAIAPVTDAQLLAVGQRPLLKLEIYVGGAWINICNLGGKNYLQDISVSLGGASMTPDPVAGSWSAVINNEDGIFHPKHPTSAYTDYFRAGRKIRISSGAWYGGTDYYWERIIGFMDEPSFKGGAYEISLTGLDYMKRLADYKFRKPDNYWGSSITKSTIASQETLGAEIYDEDDAMEIIADAANVTPWDRLFNATISSQAPGGAPSDNVGQVTKVANGVKLGYAENNNVGEVEQGKEYKVDFYYKRIVSAEMRIGIYRTGTVWQPNHGYVIGDEVEPTVGNENNCYYICTDAGNSAAGEPAWPVVENGGVVDGGVVWATKYMSGKLMGEMTDLTAVAWTQKAFYFTATEDCAIKMRVTVEGFGKTATQFQVDKFSIKEVTGTFNAAYNLPDECTGIYYVTLDAEPIYYRDEGLGWYYEKATNRIFIENGRILEAGQDLKIYYFTQQAPEDVVADILGHTKLNLLGLIKGFVSPDVDCHQGYSTDGTFHYTIHTDHIYKRNDDATWSIAAQNAAPHAGQPTDHLGDGDYHNNNLYIPAETWVDCGNFTNMRIFVFRIADLVRTGVHFIAAQGHEASGLVVVPEHGDNGIIYVISWCDGSKIWKYDLGDFSYLGYITLSSTVPELQGITYKNDHFYLSSNENGAFFNGYMYKVTLAGRVHLIYQTEVEGYQEGIDFSQDELRWLIDEAPGFTLQRVYYYKDVSLEYTATGITIDRVQFKAGTTALDAIRLICERCNYRFYFKYDGTPVFKPVGAKKADGDEDFQFTRYQLSEPDYNQDKSEILNYISIEGERSEQPVGQEEKMEGQLKGEASDSSLIPEYGEHTKSIKNHLFQDQESIDSMCNVLLEEYKTPKWYFSFTTPYNPAPLEIWDTLVGEMLLKTAEIPGEKYGTFKYNSGVKYACEQVAISIRCLIRDIKLHGHEVRYVCEEV